MEYCVKIANWNNLEHNATLLMNQMAAEGWRVVATSVSEPTIEEGSSTGSGELVITFCRE